jgi:hypothetical protein
MKDFGIPLNSKLHFHRHVDYIISHTLKLLGLTVLRNFFIEMCMLP